MLTLDEAVAKYHDDEGRFVVDIRIAETVSDIDRALLRFRAAVRDVALAELQELEPWVGRRKWLEMRARILAAFGIEDHPHG